MIFFKHILLDNNLTEYIIFRLSHGIKLKFYSVTNNVNSIITTCSLDVQLLIKVPKIEDLREVWKNTSPLD